MLVITKRTRGQVLEERCTLRSEQGILPLPLNIRKKHFVENSKLSYFVLLPHHSLRGKMCLKIIFVTKFWFLNIQTSSW